MCLFVCYIRGGMNKSLVLFCSRAIHSFQTYVACLQKSTYIKVAILYTQKYTIIHIYVYMA